MSKNVYWFCQGCLKYKAVGLAYNSRFPRGWKAIADQADNALSDPAVLHIACSWDCLSKVADELKKLDKLEG